MAEATKTVVVPVSRERFWEVITNYARYPEFVEGVHKVNILSRESGKARVEYRLELLGKDVSYTLDHSESQPAEMHWHLVESNVLKGNAGRWSLKDLGGGKTEVTYRLALDFKIYVPGMILNGLVKSQLPKMLESFEKQALKER